MRAAGVYIYIYMPGWEMIFLIWSHNSRYGLTQPRHFPLPLWYSNARVTTGNIYSYFEIHIIRLFVSFASIIWDEIYSSPGLSAFLPLQLELLTYMWHCFWTKCQWNFPSRWCLISYRINILLLSIMPELPLSTYLQLKFSIKMEMECYGVKINKMKFQQNDEIEGGVFAKHCYLKEVSQVDARREFFHRIYDKTWEKDHLRV